MLKVLSTISVVCGFLLSTGSVRAQFVSEAPQPSETREWTWMSGSSTSMNPDGSANPPVYGTKGVFAPGNNPGGRALGASWTDSAGNFWLFGGLIYIPDPGVGYYATFLSDVWEYKPTINQWAWIAGSDHFPCNGFCGVHGVYGTLGTAAPDNNPGGREDFASWVDASNHFWVYGGGGLDENGASGILDDLWEFDPATGQWTWIGGSATIPPARGVPRVFGTLGEFAPANTPGGLEFASSWTGNNGHFWLYGGIGLLNTTGDEEIWNDIWEYDPAINQWAWQGGSDTTGPICKYESACLRYPVYGTRGVASAASNPGSRFGSGTWIDSQGNLWLFGGQNNNTQDFNDLWEFFPATKEWAWMNGSTRSNDPAVYGQLGVPSAANTPDSVYWPASWTDPAGNFWLYGGAGYGLAHNGEYGYVDSLWEYNPPANQWAWMGGSTGAASLIGPGFSGVFGTEGVPDPCNIPGPRQLFTNWTDQSGNLWLYGGWGYDASGVAAKFLNDMWRYAPTSMQPPAAATPTFTPPGGSYATLPTVTISDATAATAIYYTSDGTAPTTNSALYSGPIAVTKPETLKAIAASSCYSNSAVGSATYTLTSPAPTPTNTTLTASANTLNYGQTLTLTATVKAVPPSGGTPAGTVTFNNGAVSLGKATLNAGGVAVFTLTPAVGSYSITATYQGSASYDASTSAEVGVKVVALTTTTVLMATPNPAYVGSSVQFSTAVTSAAPVSAGSVSFYDGEVLLSKIDLTNSNVATYSTSMLAVGSHKITAVYGGGAGLTASTSNTVVEVIEQIPLPTFSISASPDTRTVYTGEATSYSVTIGTGAIPVVYGSPFDLPVALSCAKLPANTTCTFSPSTITGGSGSSKLIVQTSAPRPVSESRKAARQSSLNTRAGIPIVAGLMLVFIPIRLIPRKMRRMRRSLYLLLALVWSMAAPAVFTGCSAPGLLTGATPVGAQSITVDGVVTSGSQTETQTTTVTLNVKSLF